MIRHTPYILALTCVILADRALEAGERPPRAIDERLKIELFAEHPQIVTPTGIDVDHAGRVWAIESNTHFRPDDYQGHPSDRFLVMQDTNGDHKADKITVFTDGLTHTMSIALKPLWLKSPEPEDKAAGLRPGGTPVDVYIATRRDIWLYTDDDGDLKADRKKRIIQLDTPGDYPHNGLAGFAFDAMGWMYFGFGENLGAEYKIIGSDGTTLSGGGEGGNLYRCRPDGSKLKRWATGFWNPHASCVDAFGRLFTVDNDPDSRPPCRLLHIIEGGDYGFRFRNGRKGLHPFTAWNGEIPGTLPMVSGTGEAPSGIVAYESDGFPEDYIGNLLVGSWGDHRIDRFRLKPRGASFESIPETIVQGGEDFRPVGLALAPDGSLYLTDWVKRDYNLHGHGRVWRVSVREPSQSDAAKPTPKQKKSQAQSTTEVIDAATVNDRMSAEKLKELFESRRLNVRRMAAIALSKTPQGRLVLLKLDTHIDRRQLLECMRALRTVPKDVEDFKKYRSQPGTTFANILQVIDVDEANWIVGAKSPEAPGLEFMMRSTSWGLSAKKPNSVGDIHTWSMTAHSTNDPFLFAASVYTIANARVSESTLEELVSASRYVYDELGGHLPTHRDHLAYLLAARKRYSKNTRFPLIGLRHEGPQVRRAAVQWVAEERLSELRPQVEKILDSEPMTTDLFLATLAALEMLDGKDPRDFDKTPAGKYVLPLVRDEDHSPAVRAQALRLVDANDDALNARLMARLVGSDDPRLKREAVRTLAHSTREHARRLLRGIAADERADVNLRAEAVVGLGNRQPLAAETRELLLALLNGDNAVLRSEALRSLRAAVKSDDGVKAAIEELAKTEAGTRGALAEEIALAVSGKATGGLRPPLAEETLDETLAGGNANAGRRIFFHAQSGGCYKCHTVNGRGRNIGPDLSRVGGALNRKRLIESILEPSKEVAPQFTNWTFVMASGKVHTGMIVGDTRDNVQRIGTAEGEIVELRADEVELRRPQQKSLMPEELAERLTTGELRDLLAFLESLK